MQQAGALPRRGLGDAAGAVEVDGVEGGVAALNVERNGVDHGAGALDRRPDGVFVGDVGDDALQAVGGLGERGPVGVAGGDTHDGATGEQRLDDAAPEETSAAENGDDVAHRDKTTVRHRRRSGARPGALLANAGPTQRRAPATLERTSRFAAPCLPDMPTAARGGAAR